MTDHSEEIEQVRKRLALALYEAGAWCGSCEYDGWGSCDDCREVVYRYVDAVLDVLGPERVLPGTVRRVTRPWAGLALTDEELTSVYVGVQSHDEAAAARLAEAKEADRG